MKPTRKDLLRALKNVEAHVTNADVLFDPSPSWEGESERRHLADKALSVVSRLLRNEQEV